MSIIGFDPKGRCVVTPNGRAVHWSGAPYRSRFASPAATLCGKPTGHALDDASLADVTCGNCLNAIPSDALAVSGVGNGKQSPTNGSLPRGAAVHPDVGAVGT